MKRETEKMKKKGGTNGKVKKEKMQQIRRHKMAGHNF